MRVELSPLFRFAGVVALAAAAGVIWISANPGKSLRSENLAIVKTPGIMVPDISALLPETSGSSTSPQPPLPQQQGVN